MQFSLWSTAYFVPPPLSKVAGSSMGQARKTRNDFCQLPTNRINGEAVRKLKVTPTLTAFLPPVVILFLYLGREISLEE